MSYHVANADPFITCDGCGVVAAPGPIARGGHEVVWQRFNVQPPNWRREDGKDYCVSCATPSERHEKKKRKPK